MCVPRICFLHIFKNHKVVENNSYNTVVVNLTLYEKYNDSRLRMERNPLEKICSLKLKLSLYEPKIDCDKSQFPHL